MMLMTPPSPYDGDTSPRERGEGGGIRESDGGVMGTSSVEQRGYLGSLTILLSARRSMSALS